MLKVSNEAVTKLEPLAILKQWDAILHRKIALAFSAADSDKQGDTF